MRPTEPVRTMLAATALGLAYWLTAVVGLHWALVGGAGSPVWPAAGIALAGLLLGGVRLWPAIVIARLAAALTIESQNPLWAELMIAAGNAVAAVIPVLLLRYRADIDLRLTTMRDVLWLALAAGISATLAAAFGTGILWLVSGFEIDGALLVASNWWFGNLVGMLIMTPLILAWSPAEARAMPVSAWIHLGAVLIAVAALSYAIFFGPYGLGLRTWHVFPVLIWAALAFEVRGAAAALAISSGLSIWGTTVGSGPFADLAGSEAGSIFFAQQFAAIASLTILFLAAVADERRGKQALREAEAALRKLNLELEGKVQERSAEMVQLQKMETLGRLTGGIAHDFNNLLMAVLGSLELVNKKLPAEDSGISRLIDNAVQAARRGVGLTQRMLAFARRQDLSPKPVDLAELVHALRDLLQRSLGPQIKIETHFAPAVPDALVDPNQLELALLNLAVNASDAMPEGGTLRIEIAQKDIAEGFGLAPGRYIRLAMTDTGAGMDDETLHHALEPFFTTKGVGKGTGLGLPMVHGLAEQSGGRLNLTSRPGHGTTAEILLPAAASMGRGNAGETAAPAPETAASPRLCVLVVDDDTLVLMGAVSMVEDLGHTVIEATSGAQALDVLHSGRAIDAVVTDQAMPGMTGLQLATAIRSQWPHMPIVLATGYAELPADAGDIAVERLNKPFFQHDLAAALDRATRPCRAH